MAGLLTAAALLLACVSGSDGSMVMQMRYPGYYANYGNDFNSNSAARAEPSNRIGAFAPSTSERALVNSIDFEAMRRRDETRVFHGRLRVPRCKHGKYIFRISSSNSAHLFINGGLVYSNTGSSQVETNDVTVQLKSTKQYDFELWWGNWGGTSSLKLQWVYSSSPGIVEEVEYNLIDAILGKTLGLENDDADEDVDDLFAEVLTAEQMVEGDDLDWTTDLTGLFEKQEVPTIKRCDYNGYFADDPQFFTDDKLTSKFQPGGCSLEVGGIVTLQTGKRGTEDSRQTSFTYEFVITPRVTGLHTFWAQADDAAHVYIQPKSGKMRHVVDNGSTHGPEWQHGSLFLDAGQPVTVTVHYGNAGSYGVLKLQWEDPNSDGPQDSFLPLL